MAYIREQESGDVPVSGQEDGVTAYETHNSCRSEGIPCRIWLPKSFMGQIVSGDSLSCQSILKFYESKGHDREVDQL